MIASRERKQGSRAHPPFTPFTLILYITLLFLSSKVLASEFLFQEPKLGGMTNKQYLDSKQAPNIHIKSNCSGSPITICTYFATNDAGSVIRSFSSGMSAKTTARYKDKAYAVIQSSMCSMMGCDSYQVLDSNGRISSYTQNNMIASSVGNDGNLHVMTQEHYLVRNPKGIIQNIETPEFIEDGVFGTNLDGHMAAVAIAESGALYLYDNKALINMDVRLSAHGDRDQIIAILPENNNIYIAIYRYINAYNKGLYVLRYDRTSKQFSGGWLLNSEDRNIGFNVSMYKQGNAIVINCKNASQDNAVFFKLNDEDINQLNPDLPNHIRESGFEEEDYASMMAGLTFAQLNVSLKSHVPYDSDAFKTSLGLSATETWLKGINFEGRIGDVPLTIQYIQNKTENVTVNESDVSVTKPLRRAASHQLFASVDLNNLLSSAVRLQLSDAAINGIAHVTNTTGVQSTHVFATNLRRSSAHFLFEGGGYWGVEYKTLSSPTKVGFSDYRKVTVYTGVDLETEYKTLKVLLGYDRMAYAKRYETDFSDLYWSGNINAGLGTLKFSNAFEKDVLQNNPYQSLTPNQVYGEAGFDAELGYIWQQRFRQWKGFGYSIGVGYLFNGTYLQDSRPDDINQMDAGTIYTNIGYTLFTHGPYLRFNIMF